MVKDAYVRHIYELPDVKFWHHYVIYEPLQGYSKLGLFLHLWVTKLTELQCNFSVNMLALNHVKPQLLNLLDVVKIFSAFREDVITRRTNFLLGKARDKTHILIGLAVAVANIDFCYSIFLLSLHISSIIKNIHPKFIYF